MAWMYYWIVICPTGRTKLEPVAVLILSVIMSVASLQLLWESVKVLIDLIDGSNCLPKCEIRASDNSSCLLTCDMTTDDNSSCISLCGITTSDKSSCLPQFEITTISIAASTVGMSDYLFIKNMQFYFYIVLVN